MTPKVPPLALSTSSHLLPKGSPCPILQLNGQCTKFDFLPKQQSCVFNWVEASECLCLHALPSGGFWSFYILRTLWSFVTSGHTDKLAIIKKDNDNLGNQEKEKINSFYITIFQMRLSELGNNQWNNFNIHAKSYQNDNIIVMSCSYTLKKILLRFVLCARPSYFWHMTWI